MISTLKADITGLDFDIIVNAANERLACGTGVCGAIFKKAGDGLKKECEQLGSCPIGQAVMSKAYDLPSKAIIHTVGPIYVDGSQNEDQYLRACYWNSMALAYKYLREHDMDSLSLAFPCIATGVYGFPHEAACKIAVSTISEVMKKYPDAKAIDVIFVCYEQEDYILYKKELGIR